MTFKCIKGCCECCGCIPLPKELCKQFEDTPKVQPHEILQYDENYILPITKDGKCTFLDRQTNKCLIYEHRPKICKDFGVKGRISNKKRICLCCPYLRGDGTPRPQKETNKISKEVDKKFELLKSILEAD